MNCIFCKHREIDNGKPKCTSKGGISNAELHTRMKYLDKDTDLNCSGYRPNDFSNIFKKLETGLSDAFNLIKKL
jgi:hypothetical protein